MRGRFSPARSNLLAGEEIASSGYALLAITCAGLRHSKPSITLDNYGHLLSEMQNDAARVIDELITPIQVEIPTGISQTGTSI
jgi:hypothetical protein